MSDQSPASARPAASRAKGIIAIAAGAVLLLGGGTTLALWNSSASLTAGDVQAGDLNLTLGAGTWTLDGLLTDAAPVTDPSTVRIVPGDVLTLTQTVNVTLVGDTIQADLVADTGDLLPAGAATYIDVDLAVSAGTEVTPGTYRLTPAQVASPLTATLTITFDEATPDRELVNAVLDLNEVGFTLTQANTP